MGIIPPTQVSPLKQYNYEKECNIIGFYVYSSIGYSNNSSIHLEHPIYRDYDRSCIANASSVHSWCKDKERQIASLSDYQANQYYPYNLQ